VKNELPVVCRHPRPTRARAPPRVSDEKHGHAGGPNLGRSGRSLLVTQKLGYLITKCRTRRAALQIPRSNFIPTSPSLLLHFLPSTSTPRRLSHRAFAHATNALSQHDLSTIVSCRPRPGSDSVTRCRSFTIGIPPPQQLIETIDISDRQRNAECCWKRGVRPGPCLRNRYARTSLLSFHHIRYRGRQSTRCFLACCVGNTQDSEYHEVGQGLGRPRLGPAP
jgi:hypothetical protein